MRPARLLPLLTLAALATLQSRVPAHAQDGEVHRCTLMSGESVYTDKRCEDIGGMDRLPDPGVAAASSRPYLRNGCSRTLSDLVHEISAAIDARDLNRLSGVYQWTGVSNEAANRILDRLEGVVQRPLVDIVPIRPTPSPIVDDEGNVVDDNADGYYPQTASARPRPTGLRLEQTLRNAGTPSQTVFGLHREYGCFWISF